MKTLTATKVVHPAWRELRAIRPSLPAEAAAPRRVRPLLPPDPTPPAIHRLPGWKRTMDVVGAGAGLMLLWPVMAAVAVLVKLSSPGAVIFRQKRSGLGGRPFTMYKFRTMVSGAEALKPLLLADNELGGPVFKMRRDPRVTRLGRFLRVTSLDETPQLWNVLKGEMSLVGPRPLPCEEVAALQPSQRMRLSVTPGLTGLWQVRGRAGVPFERWLDMDLHYIETRGFWTDVRILLLTVPAVVSRKGAW